MIILKKTIIFLTYSFLSFGMIACQNHHMNESDPKDQIEATPSDNNQYITDIPSSFSSIDPPKKGAYSLEDTIKHVLARHPMIDEALGYIAEANEKINGAKAGYYPKVSAGFDSGRSNNHRKGWDPKANISASQMIYDFGKASSNVKTEIAGKAMKDARLLLIVDNLTRDTANAYIEVQRYTALLKLATIHLQEIRTIAKLVKARNERGASTLSDSVQADARVEEARSTQLQMESDLKRWQAVLATYMGFGKVPSLSGHYPSWLKNACAGQSPDWKNVPSMLEAEARVGEARANYNAQTASFFPTLSLNARASRNLNNSDDLYYSSNQDKETDYYVGLNVSANLYSGGQILSNRKAASHSLNSAEYAVKNARFEAERNLLESQSQIHSTSRLQESLKARTLMMEKTKELYRKQYLDLGTRTLLDLLNAEKEFHEARFLQTNIDYDLKRLNMGCLYASGEIRTKFAIQTMSLRPTYIP